MKKNEPDGTRPAPKADADLDEWRRIKALLQAHGGWILTVVTAAVAIYALTSFYLMRRRAGTVQASRDIGHALREGAPPEQLAALARQYARAPAGPVALLGAAARHVENGRFAEAREAYLDFLKSHPGHPGAATAHLGLAYCEEGERRYEEALARFRSFAEQHPNHYLAPLAILGQGRCLEQTGRLDDAQDLYETFINDSPDSRWRPYAETSLLYIQKEKRAQAASTT